jgi:hypothetical protein
VTDTADKARRAAELAAHRRDRPDRRRHNQLARTILLGALVAAASIVWLAGEFGIDRRELAGYLAASLVFVIVPVVLALVAWLVLIAVRRLKGSVDRDQSALKKRSRRGA